ncbi:predicted protein [Uncinocarpus reesii 1704]|uniref:Wax synthase domain-containing protein n=1 Tax=Uncinocarpus reesii (strain UAMH 1704) TaxID=336963 RepID=C4JNF5_UNCRE|nr:uncharacterized protein UREG_04361 [Uncinocarpus reesii 1704]EEP79515.1 predicted protein [Uncinocarpus reesii 1704]
MEQSPVPSGYRAILAAREQEFNARLQDGQISPLIFPHDFVSLFVTVGVLLVPWPRQGAFKYARQLSFCLVLYLNILTIRKCRSRAMANGYGVGLAFIWHTIWSATLLVFNDVQGKFKRIEKDTTICETKLNGVDSVVNRDGPEERTGLGHLHGQLNGTPARRRSSDRDMNNSGTSPVKEPGRTHYTTYYRWQPFPKTFSHRLAWVLDISTFSFRGPGWNWSNPNVAPAPDKSATKSALKAMLTTTAIHYLRLDLIKVLVMQDPYFWGVLDSPPPAFFAPLGQYAGIPALAYHYLLICLGIVSALMVYYGCLCIIYLLISLSCGPRSCVRVPIDAPWLYPNLFGPFLSSVLDKGLAGAWSKWWHQVFRFAFVSPTAWVFPYLPHFLRKKPYFPLLRAIVAFALSGLIHACGSYTQLGTTRPWGPFSFFVVQVPGILIQQLAGEICAHLPFALPRWLRRWSNLAFFIFWILLTGHLVADDFAKGGVWLFEPVPVSPIRGLGFGAVGEGWWCWHGKWFGLWKGEKWWQRGVEIF